MKKRSNTPIYLVAFLLFAGGFGALFFSGLSGGIEVFSVAQAQAMPVEDLQAVRLFGTVAEHPGPSQPGARGVAFHLADENNAGLTLFVNYAGVVPDTFQPGIEVYLEGSMLKGGGSLFFEAATLRTKCPSKYEKENRT